MPAARYRWLGIGEVGRPVSGPTHCAAPTQRALRRHQSDSGRADTTFRPIQYLGSKVRVLDAIESVITDLLPQHGQVCDLFSGSGVVAGRLAARYDVLAVDIQEYARVLAEAVLNPRAVSSRVQRHVTDAANGGGWLAGNFSELVEVERAAVQAAIAGDAEWLCDILEFGSIASLRASSLSPPDWLFDLQAKSEGESMGVLSRYYGGVYFSYQQAAELDGLLRALDTLEDEHLKTTVLAAIISTASEIVSTVGSHFAQPVRPRNSDGSPKVQLMKAVARRRLASATDTFTSWLQRYSDLAGRQTSGSAVRADFREVLSQLPDGIRVVYADPPYTRDHYSRFYHVLETIALRDDPGLSLVRADGRREPSRGLYRTDRHQSPFCIASQVSGAFDSLFDGVASADAHLVLSYSPLSEGTVARPKTRLMTVEQIEAAAHERFGTVRTVAVGGFTHSKFNAASVNAASNFDAEVLIICQP